MKPVFGDKEGAKLAAWLAVPGNLGRAKRFVHEPIWTWDQSCPTRDPDKLAAAIQRMECRMAFLGGCAAMYHLMNVAVDATEAEQEAIMRELDAEFQGIMAAAVEEAILEQQRGAAMAAAGVRE
jgi:hypothetical protein